MLLVALVLDHSKTFAFQTLSLTSFYLEEYSMWFSALIWVMVSTIILVNLHLGGHLMTQSGFWVTVIGIVIPALIAVIILVSRMWSRRVVAVVGVQAAQAAATPSGPGMFAKMFASLGEVAKKHSLLLAGFLFVAFFGLTLKFGFNEDDTTRSVVMLVFFGIMAGLCFLAYWKKLEENLGTVACVLWLIASVLAGFLVIQAAEEEVMHIWDSPFVWYFLLSAVSALMAFLAMIGRLGKAVEKVGHGFGHFLAALCKAFFFQYNTQLAWLLWLGLFGTLFWAGLAIGRGELLSGLEVDTALLKNFLMGCAGLAVFSGIGFFASFLTSRKPK